MVPSVFDNLFRLAVIQRWNEFPKPFDITELDKQGHKAIVAYIFARIEETERKKRIDWKYLIEGLIFEALQRSVLTDLKPPVFHKLIQTRKREINDYVIKNFSYFKDFLPNFYKRFEAYLNSEDSLEKFIIKGSHFVPTYWEFQFIYPIAKPLYGVEKVKEEIEHSLEDYHHLIGIQRFLLKRKLYGFINLCGQLRFQKRWIAVERIPKTSVMGHMFTVATLSYLLLEYLTEKGWEISDNTKYGTFFTALFHDLPEIVTRDIISPLKEVLGKEEIRKLEIEGLENQLLKLLPDYLRREMRAILGISDSLEYNEFSDRIIYRNGTFEVVEKDIKPFLANEEGFTVWGGLIKFVDLLSAYYEAYYTIKHGLKNEELERAMADLKKELKKNSIMEIFGNLVFLPES
jgi:putative hydrolase of HD superfamily